MDRTDGKLDAAVIEYRNAPNPDARANLFAAMKAHNESFLREQTGDFQRRTKIDYTKGDSA